MTSSVPLQELKAVQSAERRYRMRIAAIGIPLLLGIVLILFYFFELDREFFLNPGYRSYDERQQRQPLFAITALILLALSGLGALMLYLQTGFKRKKGNTGIEPSIYSDALDNLEKYVNASDREHEAKIDELRKANRKTEEEVALLRQQQSISLAPQERTEFLSLLTEKLQSSANADVIDGLKKQWTLDLDRDSQIKLVSTRLDSINIRLKEELEAVNRRGSTNLSIGIFTTLSGLGVLGATVFDKYTGGSEPQDILLHYLPRISLVLFIEVFAYFFLKLYKASLAEVRYFQNELTNIESRFTALIVALHRPQELGAIATVAALANTERNFLLKPGETTVDIEAQKIESERHKGIISELRAMLRRDDENKK